MRDYRIVVGVDDSPSRVRALRWAAHQAHAHHGTVQAVMAYDWVGTEAALLAGIGPEGERRRAEDLLDEAVADVRREFPDVPIAAEAVLGMASHKLVEAAADADLLVVGSHGRGHLHHAVLGSVSEACIRHAHCPVVVIPVSNPMAQTPAELATRSGT